MIEPNLYLGLAMRHEVFVQLNAPIFRSVHDENTYYHGAQYLLKTTDEGLSWQVVSPDLTKNDDSKQGKGADHWTNEAVGAENYGTLSYVVESPHEAGVIYTGSDDGLLHITKDGGKTWNNITPKGLEETLINSIEVSPHNPATVYFAATRYKFNDFTLLCTKVMTMANVEIHCQRHSTRFVHQSNPRGYRKKRPFCLQAPLTGFTFHGMAGKWQSFQGNLPITPINDLSVAHNDLVIATQGRSFWILDDLELLRQWETKNQN